MGKTKQKPFTRSRLLFCLQICGSLARVSLLPDPRSPSDLRQTPTQLSPRLPKPKVSLNHSLQRRPEHSLLQSTKEKKKSHQIQKISLLPPHFLAAAGPGNSSIS